MKTLIAGKMGVMVFLVAAACVVARDVQAAAVYMLDQAYAERLDDQSFRQRNLLVPCAGFVSVDFAWNPQNNAWVFNGNFSWEAPAAANLELWLTYWNSPTPVGEKFTVWADGLDLTDVSFVAPSGITYTGFTPVGSFGCVNEFHFEVESLPVGQTEFTDGEYVFTFTFASGPPLQKSFYVSGAYPLSFDITYPADGSTGIPLSPTVRWNAVGAGGYDFCLYDITGTTEIYNSYISNSLDSELSHTIPAGVLSPNTSYHLTIEAEAPAVNGGQKGIKKSVDFTTGN